MTSAKPSKNSHRGSSRGLWAHAVYNRIFLLDSCVMKFKHKRLCIRAELRRQQKFLKLAEEFRRTEDPKEVRRLGHKLGKLVFGE
jgi:hypothetical protein